MDFICTLDGYKLNFQAIDKVEEIKNCKWEAKRGKKKAKGRTLKWKE